MLNMVHALILLLHSFRNDVCNFYSKTEKTRKKRINQLVELSANGEKLKGS